MTKSFQLNPYIAGILFSVFIGFSFLAIKIALSYGTALEILTYRFNFALVGVGLLLLFRIKKLDFRKLKNKSVFLLGTFYILFMILQIIGLHFADSVEGALLFAIIPILVQIIARIFLGEKMTPLQTFFICLSVGGLMIMIVMGTREISVNPLGTLFLVLASVCMASSNIFMRSQREQYTPFEMTTSIILQGVVVFNLSTIAYGLIQGTLSHYFQPLTHITFVFSTLYLGVFCILASSALMGYMQKRLKAAKASLFANLATAISIVVGIVILGEVFRVYHIICAMAIIIGVVGVNSVKEEK